MTICMLNIDLFYYIKTAAEKSTTVEVKQEFVHLVFFRKYPDKSQSSVPLVR